MPTPRSIQRTYLTLLLGNTLAASLIWGINTIFLLDAGLSNLEAFAANAFFTAGMVLFEVPTGIVADSWGRRASYLLGTVTLAVTTVLYVLLWYAHGTVTDFINAVALDIRYSRPDLKVYLANKSFYNGEIKAYSDPISKGGKDVAILKMDANNLPTVQLGDSSNIHIQDPITVIGYPAAASRALRDIVVRQLFLAPFGGPAQFARGTQLQLPT